jgi:hypothetical protein
MVAKKWADADEADQQIKEDVGQAPHLTSKITATMTNVTSGATITATMISTTITATTAMTTTTGVMIGKMTPGRDRTIAA